MKADREVLAGVYEYARFLLDERRQQLRDLQSRSNQAKDSLTCVRSLEQAIWELERVIESNSRDLEE